MSMHTLRTARQAARGQGALLQRSEKHDVTALTGSCAHLHVCLCGHITWPPCRYEEWLQGVRMSPTITLPIDDRQLFAKVSNALDYYIYCEWRRSRLQQHGRGVCVRGGGALDGSHRGGVVRLPLTCVPTIVPARSLRYLLDSGQLNGLRMYQEAIMWRAFDKVLATASVAGVTLSPTQTSPIYLCALAHNASAGSPMAAAQPYCNVSRLGHMQAAARGETLHVYCTSRLPAMRCCAATTIYPTARWGASPCNLFDLFCLPRSPLPPLHSRTRTSLPECTTTSSRSSS